MTEPRRRGTAPEVLVIPEQQLNDFVTRLRQSAGDNLESIILYGSAATAEFVPDHSDVNLLCLLRDTSYQSLTAIAPAVKWWNGKKHPSPLILARGELEHSADVFAIEFTDMQHSHRVLYGSDPVANLKIPMQMHRAQVEYELREKTILLRQHLLLAAGNEKHLWQLLLDSVSAFATLFRHALIALGDPAPQSKRDAVERLAARIAFDATAFLEVLDIRHGRRDRKQLDVSDVVARYLAAVERVTAAVDAMLDSSRPAGS